MERSYAAQYRDLYTKHWWWRAREKMLLDVLSQFYPDRTDLRILDVGCGDGLFFPALKRFGTPEGIEPCAEIVTARGRADGDIRIGYFDDSYRSDAKYDLIVMADVIEHIADEQPILRKARGLLARNGRLLISVPALQCLWTHHDDLNLHKRRYTKDTLEQALALAGFTVSFRCYAFIWPALVKLLMHQLEAFTTRRKNSVDVPCAPLNALLTRWTLCEWAVLRRIGFAAPFGSSLFAVAEPSPGTT